MSRATTTATIALLAGAGVVTALVVGLAILPLLLAGIPGGAPTPDTCLAAAPTDDGPVRGVPDQWVDDVTDAATVAGVAPAVIAAQIEAESGWNPRATSHAGAVGLAQFMPDTWAAYGQGDPYDPEASIAAQGRYMAEGVRSCWEQSPTGAVFAAAYMVGLGSTGQSRVLLEELTADSPGRDQLLASVPESTVPGARKVQLVGFKVLDYTPERARVQIAATIDDTFHQALTQDLVWEGDWRLYVPSTGDTERTPLATTEGFTPFAAHPEGV